MLQPYQPFYSGQVGQKVTANGRYYSTMVLGGLPAEIASDNGRMYQEDSTDEDEIFDVLLKWPLLAHHLQLTCPP